MIPGALQVEADQFQRHGDKCDLDSHEDETEDGEYLQLQVGSAITDHPEGETVEKTRKDVQRKLVGNVFGIPEQGYRIPMAYDFALFPETGREFFTLFVVCNRPGQGIFFDVV